MPQEFPIRVGFEVRHSDTAPGFARKFWRLQTSTINSDGERASVVLLIRFDHSGTPDTLRCEFSYNEGDTLVVVSDEDMREQLELAEIHAFDDIPDYEDSPDTHTYNEVTGDYDLTEKGEEIIEAARQSVWNRCKPFNWCDTMGLGARSAHARLLAYWQALRVIINLDATI